MSSSCASTVTVAHSESRARPLGERALTFIRPHEGVLRHELDRPPIAAISS